MEPENVQPTEAELIALEQIANLQREIVESYRGIIHMYYSELQEDETPIPEIVEGDQMISRLDTIREQSE